MNLGSSLEIRQTRTLAMTAQLRQAIGMLQFNNAELRAFVAREVQKNPLLEMRLAGGAGPGDGARSAASGRAPDTPGPGVRMDMAGAIPAAPASLVEHVARQIGIAIRDPRRRRIAFAFLEALEPYGWLGRDVGGIAAGCGCTPAEAEEVLSVLQGFEPAGLFARSLEECLRLQAQDQDVLDAVLSAMLARLDLVAQGDLELLAEFCGCAVADVAARLKILRGFDPKPGAAFGGDAQPLRAPDLILSEGANGWRVELNASTLPEVVVREDMVRDRDLRDAFVAEALATARSLKRAIEQRNANTLAVAAEIVRRQGAYLEDPAAHLVPLSLRDVAGAVSLHESTVSRITTGMTIDTPRGLMELRGFFCRGLPGAGEEGAVPVTLIRGRIAEMIRAEAPARPLSDEGITALLRREGIEIQRRTVAKYRAMMGIPGSSARRRTGRARPAP
ncbi:RNA polymerase factor sigma-54 [Actibacterium sp. MT2.3-13A]|uniref:RNA polymerase factor sigma-54 n=1 Tax=Actibacterium sp. MT2.3-13A TaxID=2828332 RepID=UPI001BA82812|nr:RNA polymerase factor sigma-54 [Actibacterium sp. MT2.3-13A]